MDYSITIQRVLDAHFDRACTAPELPASLQYAAGVGSQAIVKMLLDEGVDVSGLWLSQILMKMVPVFSSSHWLNLMTNRVDPTSKVNLLSIYLNIVRILFRPTQTTFYL